MEENTQEEIQQEQEIIYQEETPGKIKEWTNWLKEFWTDCARVLKITKKPTKDEFTTIVKIAGAGILAIGAIGFLVHYATELIKKLI